MLDEKYNFKKIATDRTSGILMHISSLPGPYGIGNLGQEARNFVDFLARSGQTYWQMLPVGPTGYGDSPYQSFSTFAGNPYLIDLDNLRDWGLLSQDDLNPLNQNLNPETVDYGRIFNERFPVLRKAFDNFDTASSHYQEFCRNKAFWLNDYALYMAIKDFHQGASWITWDDSYKFRDEKVLKDFEEKYPKNVEFYRFIQYLFFDQWQKLKDYISSKGIKTIGDLPIYVAEDSADTWAHPELFQLNEDLTPKFVGGCPPDGFSESGQLWGNPCYNWENNEKEEFSWWTQRIKCSFDIFDCIRIDHFRGFESYWAIPAGDDTAKNGSWQNGPGLKLFNKIKEKLGDIPIIAEDLGYMTKEVYEFREATGFPGMKILQFAFDPQANSDYLPHNITVNSVVYTGTHDNDTVKGWLEESARPEEIDLARRYLSLSDSEGYVWGMMRGALTSVAKMAILQMQDLLELGNSARMNAPGTLGNNWTWRMKEGQLTDELAGRLHELTRISGRLNK